LHHSFRLESDAFKNGNIVLEGPSRHLSGPEIADMLDNLVLKENEDEFIGYRNKHNWTHEYVLWELPYVKAPILMHNINVMH
jgi:hypothetical protein